MCHLYFVESDFACSCFVGHTLFPVATCTLTRTEPAVSVRQEKTFTPYLRRSKLQKVVRTFPGQIAKALRGPAMTSCWNPIWFLRLIKAWMKIQCGDWNVDHLSLVVGWVNNYSWFWVLHMGGPSCLDLCMLGNYFNPMAWLIAYAFRHLFNPALQVPLRQHDSALVRARPSWRTQDRLATRSTCRRVCQRCLSFLPNTTTPFQSRWSKCWGCQRRSLKTFSL